MSKKKKSSRHSGRSSTTLEKHHKTGSVLTPPLANLPHMKPASWVDERLPEFLWVALLVTHLPRENCIKLFRQFAETILVHEPADKRPFDISLSGLSHTSDDIFRKFIEPVMGVAGCRQALAGLMVLDDFPGSERWERILGEEAKKIGWAPLMHTLALTLNHQSQESTDCRWFRVLCFMAGNKLTLQSQESVHEVVEYPYYGDQRKVRPMIRATEIALHSLLESEDNWPERFWIQCFQKTACWPLSFSSDETQIKIGTNINRVKDVYAALTKHHQETARTTTVDAQHDIVFGMCLYGLTLLHELLQIGVSKAISGRMTLRTITELVVTLAYLIQKNDPETWRSYRIFGAGQAKLQYLKLDTAAGNTSYVDIDTLVSLANEDMWEEYLPIELGHWENSNLRKLSIDAGMKDIYDEYYVWTSTYAHGHWGAIRDSVFTTCGNPLHRLHRIARDIPKSPPDVIPDACRLIDHLLSLLNQCYPGFSERVTVET
jgi:hypothetical protein